tara:strand:+ start:830 stop:985 length:156 start_codon:yes stop_codon:yes gene_type:complete
MILAIIGRNRRINPAEGLLQTVLIKLLCQLRMPGKLLYAFNFFGGPMRARR